MRAKSVMYIDYIYRGAIEEKYLDRNCYILLLYEKNMSELKHTDILKMYAPMCKVDGCTNDCQIAYDSYGKIDFHHCHDCHFKYVGKGFYMTRIVNGVTGEEQFDFDDDGRRID